MKSKDQPIVLNAMSRLREALRLWQRAAESYLDAEEFRINVNACIQALRNVTFVLQKQRSEIDGFDDWYSAWQTALKRDIVMGWCVEARNIIVKEGDLRIKSIAKASYVASYLESPVRVFPADPFRTPLEISEYVRDKLLPAELKNSGYLRVEKQWIDEAVTNSELLEALAHAFVVLSALVNDVRDRQGPSRIYDSSEDVTSSFRDAIDSIDVSDYPRCMSSFETYREVLIKLSTGDIVTFERTEPQTVSREEAIKDYGELVTKYGKIDSRKDNAPLTLQEEVRFFLDLGKNIRKVDEFHMPMVITLDEKNRCNITQTSFDDNDDKYVFWHNFAKEVKRRKITKVIVIAEIWIAAFDPRAPLRRAADAPNKREGLHAAGISETGEKVSLIALFKRENGKVVFEDTQTFDGEEISFLEPVQQVWEKKRKRKVLKKRSP